jgi:PAS domain S-box-containing protein
VDLPNGDSAGDLTRLRNCLNDLTTMLELPAQWTDGGHDHIVSTFVDALLGTLRLDFVCVRLNDPEGGQSVETVRVAESLQYSAAAGEISWAIDRSLGQAQTKWPPRAQVRIKEVDLSVACVPLGLRGEIGAVLAGSRRPDFPTQAEKLVLDVAANQTTLGLQEARLLRESERNSHVLMDNIPGLVALLTTGGEVQFVNHQILEYIGGTLEDMKHWGTNGTVHPEDLPGLLQIFTQSIASGSAYDIEQRLRRWDGAYLWFQNKGFPLRDPNGRIVCWCVLLTDIDERKRAEDALRESERESRQIVDSIPGFVTAFAPSGELEFVNLPMLQYLGKTLEELKRWRTDNTTHPEDLPRFTELFTHSIGSGEPFELELRARRFDGVYRWFQSRGFPLRDTNGQVVRWYNLLIDIDERKRAEEALRTSELNLRQMTETIPEMLWSATPDGAIDYCNARFLNYTGFSAEEVMDNGWQKTIHPDDAVRAAAVWMAAVTTATPYRVEVRTFHRADGTYRWCAVSALPLQDQRGRILKWHGTIVDVHDWKLAEDAIRTSEQHLKTIIDTIPALAWSARPDGSANFFNQHFLDFIGFSTEQARGWGWTTAVHPEDLHGLTVTWQQALASGSPGEAEARLHRYDGTYRWFLFRTNPLRDENGAIVEWYGVNTDIEDRKLAEEALSRARSELAHVTRVTTLSALTASIAHEVNQPLSGIITNASTGLRMLDADPPNVEGARETVKRTLRDGNRASDVITRLRALFSKRDFTFELLDLNEAAREVIALSVSEFQQNQVMLRLELAADLPNVIGDRVQLQQVILNLFRNASDAMADVHDRPRQLLLKTEREHADRVCLSVRDAGVGLPLESLDTLFNPFHSTKVGGMGIGLFVSRSIIERHHGRLWGEPNDSGPGATFSFSIPRDAGSDLDAAYGLVTS